MGPTSVVLVAGGAVAAAATAWSILWWYEGEKCEKPKYSVKTVLQGRPKHSIRDFNVMEIREYEPYVVAQATVTGGMKKSMSVGFMKVARYIFGDNTKKGAEGDEKEKVAMTSPVIMEMPAEQIAMTSPVQMQAEEASGSGNGTDGSKYKISFVMPSSYTMETLPVPKDTELELKEVPAHTLAAYTYFGAPPSETRIGEVADKLKAKLQEEGMKVSGSPLLYQYHPPFAPSFLRRVEVLFSVE